MMCDILHRISKMWLLFVCCYLFGFGYFLVGFHVILVESVGKEVVVEGGTEESNDDGCGVMADLLDWFTDYY